MVLYYGLFALEAANSTIATAARTTRSTTNIPRITSDRTSASRKQKHSSNSIGKMTSSSLSSSNSWIYTEDLRKRFEERYADCRYVIVPVYIDRKSAHHSHSTTGILPQQIDRENSWMYSRSLRDHLFYSTSKISLPLTTNISSSACCVTNHGFMRDELPVKKNLKSRLFKRSLSAKDKTTTTMSLSSSTSSFSTANHLLKHRTTDVVEEEDDEGIVDENHSIPLIKQDSMIASTSRTTVTSPTNSSMNVNPTAASEQTHPTSALSNTKSSIQQPTTHNKRLTRLRSFFFRTSSSSARAQQQTTLPNQISRT